MKKNHKKLKNRTSSFKKSWKSYLSFSLAVTIVLYTSMINIVVYHINASTATDRVTTYINLAKNETESEDFSIGDLTQDELRFLGVYLSNFYIPFATELGVGSSETNEETVNQISSALKLNLNFSEEMSMVLAEEILSLSRANSQELKFYASVDYHDGDYVEIGDFNTNYYNFLRLMLGEYKAVFQGYSQSYLTEEFGVNLLECVPYKDTLIPNSMGLVKWTTINPPIQRLLGGTDSSGKPAFKYGYFAYTDSNGTVVPMFDCALSQTEKTACQTAFLQCLGSVDISKGFGFNFYDFTTDEIANSSDLSSIFGSNISTKVVYEEDCTDSDMDKAYELSIYNTKIAIDCFGNLIQKGFCHQYIAVPACMNPYTWVLVDENGLDVSESKGNEHKGAGYAYNAINFASLSEIDNGTLLESTGGQETGSQARVCKISTQSLETQLNKVKKDQNVYMYSFEGKDKKIVDYTIETYPLRFFRGSSDYNFSAEASIATSIVNNGTSGVSNIEYFNSALLAQWGFRKSNPTDFTYYYSCARRINTTSAKGSDNSTDGLDTRHEGWLNNNGKRNYNSSESVSCWGEYKSATNNTAVIDNIVFIDNLGAFNYDSGGSIDYQVLNIDHYISKDSTSTVKLLESYSEDPNNGFVNNFSNMQSGKLNTSINVGESAVVSVYTTYTFAGLYSKSAEGKKNTIGKLGFRINIEGLLPISNNKISVPTSISDKLVDNQIRSWVYYLLHPTKGYEYTTTLIRNKTNALFVGWHNDIVGTNKVGSVTGSTAYKPTTGFVTTPDLTEYSWTNALLGFFQKVIPFLIIVMLVIMLLSFIAGLLSLQKAIFGLALFSVFLFIPLVLSTKVVGLSNNISQRIYGDKFTYWALVQQESYAHALDTAASGNSYSNYLRTLYAENNQTYQNQGGDSIVLKWQCPKKMSSLMFTKEDTSMINNLASTKLLGTVLNNNTFSGESYLENDSVYMYRSYSDLSNFSRYIYNGIKMGNQESYNQVNVSNTTTSLQSSMSSMQRDYNEYVGLGFTNTNGSGSSNISESIRLVKPFSSKMYNDAIKAKGTIKDMTIYDYVGINQDVFNFSVAMFNQKNISYSDVLLDDSNVTQGNKEKLTAYLNGYPEADKDLAGLASYALLSESPFYYFSWCLYDQGLSTLPNAKGGYRELLLGKANAGYFYNVEVTTSRTDGVIESTTLANGELKDFLDMRSLFTYVIPYLKEGNDVVREWDGVYGIFIYEGVPTSEGHLEDMDITSDPELKQKYWHNLNVARLYEIYTPWVDLMYDCSYAKPETIKVLGTDFTVEDPLNPASYPEERPMVFSESELAMYGLGVEDLTKVEKKILECNEAYQERMYELLNYYNFSDVTLNTASAMNCTFVFNSIFSESSANIDLYPQSFELTNFSYDAFLRFILSNSLNEDLTGKDDFYLAVVEKSSTLTAVMLLASDLLSQYALPALKIFILVALFISTVLLVLVTAFKKYTTKKFILNLLFNIVKPFGLFLGLNIAFAWTISLFMGSGNTAVTNTTSISIKLGDPVVTLLALIALNVICILAYVKIIWGVLKDIKQNSSFAVSFIKSAVKGSVASVGKGISKNISNTTETNNYIRDSKSETPNGSPSSRATQRSSVSYSKESEGDVRDSYYNERVLYDLEGDDISSNDSARADKINSTIAKGKEKVKTDDRE